ncbi:MAG: hypothetical protein ACLR8P_23660 [Clostridium fessum]
MAKVYTPRQKWKPRDESEMITAAKEQRELASEIAELEKAIRDYEQTRKSAGMFIAMIL